MEQVILIVISEMFLCGVLVRGFMDDSSVGGPTVILNKGVYEMWYHASDGSWKYRIGYAISLDGINWSKYDLPVLGLGDPGEWDYFQVGVKLLSKTA